MSRIGERLSTTAPRYIKHPAHGEGWAGDSVPMDAGTAMILDNNLSHLSNESLRHWGSALGPGSNVSAATVNGSTGYDDIESYVTDAFGSSAAKVVAWDVRTSFCFGPFALIQDRPLARGGYGPRKVRVAARCAVTGAAVFRVAAALTATPTPPNDQPGGVLVIGVPAGTVNAIGNIPTGTGTHTIDLECPDPVPVNSVWRARSGGARGPASIDLPLAWLWVGWYLHSGTATLINVDCYETR